MGVRSSERALLVSVPRLLPMLSKMPVIRARLVDTAAPQAMDAHTRSECIKSAHKFNLLSQALIDYLFLRIVKSSVKIAVLCVCVFSPGAHGGTQTRWRKDEAYPCVDRLCVKGVPCSAFPEKVAAGCVLVFVYLLLPVLYEDAEFAL